MVTLVTAAVALVAPSVAPAALPFAQCGQPAGIVCATLTVPLDRSGAVPGTVRLFLEKKPTAAMPPQGALFYLGGGPGSTATDGTESIAHFLAPALTKRDLIVMDYRGVGLSEPLSCRATDRAACALELGSRRFFYTTRDMVEDVEAARVAIGIDKIAVFGVSYGTKIAQAYARRYGDHIEFLVVDGIVPTDGWDPWSRSAYRAIPRILRAICTGGDCRGITTDPARDLATLIQRTGRSELRLRYVDTDGSQRLIRTDLQGLFRIYYGDHAFEAAMRARLPAAVAAFLRGDTYPLGRLWRQRNWKGEATANHGPPADNDVAWPATMCEDIPLPWRGETTREGKLRRIDAQLATFAADAFAPFPNWVAATSPMVTDCLPWSSAPQQPVILPRVRYTGRMLMLEGEVDQRTPVEDAQAALAEFPQATLVTVPSSGHGVVSTRCGSRALVDFVAGRQPQPCGAARSPTRPAPIPPTSLQKVAPWPGVAGKRGRTIRAVVETVRDVGYTVWTTGPFLGLRGGRFTTTRVPNARAVLNKIVYVPGVVVSGRFDDVAHTARVTVSGSGSRGTLTIAARSITGRLDGKAIKARGASLLIRDLDNR